MIKLPAIILARGGSRRLPRKNIKKLCGRPLVEWSVLQARNSHLVSNVYVSTDDDEIEEISMRAGAYVLREPVLAENGNRPPGTHALLWAMNILNERGEKFDSVLDILPSSVVRKPDDFDNAIRLFYQLNAQEVAPKFIARECYVSKILSDNLMRRTTFGKNFEYAINGEQWSVMKVDFCRQYVASLPKTDKELDALLSLGEAPEWAITFHYYPIEWFQQYDIDDWNDFCMQEILMQQYILDVYGEDCYECYGRGET